MNTTQLANQFLGMLWYVIPFIVFGAVLKSAWFKGVFGEFKVNMGAKFFLDKEIYHLISNITLPTDNGSTQIDHIIVSQYGVFVLETKNMSGWIFGNPQQKTWTQKIYKHTSKFQNPLHQNYKHVKTLEAILNLNDQQIFSVVIFVGSCTLKTQMSDNVIKGLGYIRYIKSKTQQVLTTVQVGQILNKIDTGRLTPSLRTNLDHIHHVQNIIEKKKTTNSTTCPRCGNSMVLRQAKRGQNKGADFWGCSTFPKCRGIVNIEK